MGFNTCRIFVQYLVWFHDLFYPDGQVYQSDEIDVIKATTWQPEQESTMGLK